MSDSSISGTITLTRDDGTECVAHYIVDLYQLKVIQIGGEGEIDAENEELILTMLGLAREAKGSD